MLGIPPKLAWTIVLIAALGPGCTAARDEVSTPQGKWLAADIGGAAVADGVQTTLDIAADGAVSGSGGCNRYGGTADITGSSISFGPLAATRMACPPAQMDQETKFFDALERARSWKIAGSNLLLLGSDGTAVVRLNPAQGAASIIIPLPNAQAVDGNKVACACRDIAADVECINAGDVALVTLVLGDVPRRP